PSLSIVDDGNPADGPLTQDEIKGDGGEVLLAASVWVAVTVMLPPSPGAVSVQLITPVVAL
ncbi:hypothetical protein, partial [Shewanella sp. Sh95]|uniref:hypothetical protein n=1 Tax=Shewanella sp. Sh95 TaxID=1689868 RepID=UPI001E6346AA